MVSDTVGSIYPSKLERANSLRAITGKVAQANTPIVEAIANTLGTALSVTRTGIITSSLNGSNK